MVTRVITKSTNRLAYNTVRDDMFNYQCSFVKYGMLICNFQDAISEGDGHRLIRCWKFFVLYLRNDGSSSTKYALEVLYLLCQRYALLSPRVAHHVVWDRFFKSKNAPAANIRHDLALEHFNCFIKTIVKNIRHNATNHGGIDRYCKALPVSKAIVDNWDKTAYFIKRSGKHVKQAVKKDLMKLVNELIEQNALTETSGWKYSHFPGVPNSLLEGFNLHALLNWIDAHKKKILTEKVAR